MPMRNQVRLPATILRNPVFSATAPKAFNYGGLGTIAGHDIMHAFSLGPIHLDGHGQFGPWWSNDSSKEYDARLSCIRRMFLARNDSTDSEILSDFTGLVSGYDAFMKLKDKYRQEAFDELPYGAEQLFFISSCVKTCATRAEQTFRGYVSWRDRCEIPLRMLGAFGEAFHCSIGSRMWIHNRSQRCFFW